MGRLLHGCQIFYFYHFYSFIYLLLLKMFPVFRDGIDLITLQTPSLALAGKIASDKYYCSNIMTKSSKRHQYSYINTVETNDS